MDDPFKLGLSGFHDDVKHDATWPDEPTDSELSLNTRSRRPRTERNQPARDTTVPDEPDLTGDTVATAFDFGDLDREFF